MRKNYRADCIYYAWRGAWRTVEEHQQKLCRFRCIAHRKMRLTALGSRRCRMPATSLGLCACHSITRDADVAPTDVV